MSKGNNRKKTKKAPLAIEHTLLNFYGLIQIPESAKPTSPKLFDKTTRTRKAKKPSQVELYGAVIHKLRKAGVHFKDINNQLGITGSSMVYFRYRERKRTTGSFAYDPDE